MSIDELLAILKAVRDKENAQRKFTAALQGVDIDDDEDKGDITELKGYQANEVGFGIGIGLGYSVEGE